MLRKIAPVLVIALLFGLSACKRDAEIETFLKDFTALTDDIVKKVEAAPNATGVDEAQKLLDGKKAEMKTKITELKNMKGYVSEDMQKKFADGMKANGEKIGGLATKFGVQALKDPQFQPKLVKLMKDYTDMLQ